MWAPVGYEVFSGVSDIFWNRAAAAIPLSSGVRPTKDILKERHELYQWMISEYFATCPSLFVASPEGQVMRVAPEMGFYADEPQVEETYKGHLFLNADTWTVDIERLEERARAANALFEKEKRSLQLADQINELAWVARMARCGPAFRHFQGWALIVKEGQIETLSTRPFECLDEIEQQSGSAPRPKSEEVVADILREFDNDNSLTKPVIKSRVAPDMIHTAFELDWKTAKKQRVGLGRRGRRPRLS